MDVRRVEEIFVAHLLVALLFLKDIELFEVGEDEARDKLAVVGNDHRHIDKRLFTHC